MGERATTRLYPPPNLHLTAFEIIVLHFLNTNAIVVIVGTVCITSVLLLLSLNIIERTVGNRALGIRSVPLGLKQPNRCYKYFENSLLLPAGAVEWNPVKPNDHL